MTTLREPDGLAAKGARLWADLTEAHEFGPADLVILEEACRIADRLDQLDGIVTGRSNFWARFRVNEAGDEVRITVDAVLAEARQQAAILARLIASLRLPDAASGKRPQHRGAARGTYQKGGAGVVSSLDRARAARRA